MRIRPDQLNSLSTSSTGTLQRHQVHRQTPSHTHCASLRGHGQCTLPGQPSTVAAIGDGPHAGQGEASPNPLTGKKQLTCSVTGAHRALQDEDNLREALRYSAAMLGELRTSSLTPQKYFELYMQVFDELRHLEVGTPTVCSCNWQVSPATTKPACGCIPQNWF